MKFNKWTLGLCFVVFLATSLSSLAYSQHDCIYYSPQFVAGHEQELVNWTAEEFSAYIATGQRPDTRASILRKSAQDLTMLVSLVATLVAVAMLVGPILLRRSVIRPFLQPGRLTG